MTFNVDFSGDDEELAKITAKLEEKGIGPDIENVLSGEPADDIYNKLDLGSVPAVYVFDQSGELAERFDNNDLDKYGKDGFSYEQHIGPLVEKLLGQ